MSEKLPQDVIDSRFASIVADLKTARNAEQGGHSNESIFVATIMDHWRHLKDQGYSDEEIEGIFDLVMTEGGVHEV